MALVHLQWESAATCVAERFSATKWYAGICDGADLGSVLMVQRFTDPSKRVPQDPAFAMACGLHDANLGNELLISMLARSVGHGLALVPPATPAVTWCETLPQARRHARLQKQRFLGAAAVPPCVVDLVEVQAQLDGMFWDLGTDDPTALDDDPVAQAEVRDVLLSGHANGVLLRNERGAQRVLLTSLRPVRRAESGDTLSLEWDGRQIIDAFHKMRCDLDGEVV